MWASAAPGFAVARGQSPGGPQSPVQAHAPEQARPDERAPARPPAPRHAQAQAPELARPPAQAQPTARALAAAPGSALAPLGAAARRHSPAVGLEATRRPEVRQRHGVPRPPATPSPTGAVPPHAVPSLHVTPSRRGQERRAIPGPAWSPALRQSRPVSVRCLARAGSAVLYPSAQRRWLPGCDAHRYPKRPAWPADRDLTVSNRAHAGTAVRYYRRLSYGPNPPTPRAYARIFAIMTEVATQCMQKTERCHGPPGCAQHLLFRILGLIASSARKTD
jgi:hypothetical protein